MTVLNGQLANQTTFNNGFASKQANNTFQGIQNLNNISSGDQITNVQLMLNQMKPITPTGQAVLTDIELQDTFIQIVRVQGDSAPVVLTTEPFGNSLTFPCFIILLIGISDTDTLTIEHSDTDYGCILNGNCELKKNHCLALTFSFGDLRFIELFRNV